MQLKTYQVMDKLERCHLSLVRCFVTCPGLQHWYAGRSDQEVEVYTWIGFLIRIVVWDVGSI